MSSSRGESLVKWLEQGHILKSTKNGMMIWETSSKGVTLEYNGIEVTGDGIEFKTDGIEIYSLTTNGKKVIADIDCSLEDLEVVDEFLGRVFCYAQAPGMFLVMEKRGDSYYVLEFSDTEEYGDRATVGTIKEEQLCDMFYKKHTIATLKVDDGIDAVAQLIRRMAVNVE